MQVRVVIAVQQPQPISFQQLLNQFLGPTVIDGPVDFKRLRAEDAMIGRDVSRTMKKPIMNMNGNGNDGFSWSRFVLFNTLALFLALGANFLGVTSSLMSNTNPAFFRSAKLDQLYSIEGYRRYVSAENKYEFVFPNNWLIDQSVLLANINNRSFRMFL